jgi:hypothetical protein
MQGSILAPDIFVIKARSRRRFHERFVNGTRDVEIPVDRAIPELDLEGVKPFAVADRGERFRFDRDALDAGNDSRIGRRPERRAGHDCRDKQQARCQRAGGTPRHWALFVARPFPWCLAANTYFVIVLVLEAL